MESGMLVVMKEQHLREITANTMINSKSDIDTKQIHWLDLPGNKYLKKLEPGMLLPDGCVNRQEIRPVGAKRFESREWVEVLYDKRYVVSRILIDILQPLNIKSLQRLLSLMIDVWVQAENSSNYALTEANKIRLLLSNNLNPAKAITKTIDLKALKPRRLHGKNAYFADELLAELQNQGFVVAEALQELVSTVDDK